MIQRVELQYKPCCSASVLVLGLGGELLAVLGDMERAVRYCRRRGYTVRMPWGSWVVFGGGGGAA